MRAIVLSDSHGAEDTLRRILTECWKRVGPVDAYLHLGDGARDFDRVAGFIHARDEHALLLGVKGNCDFGLRDVPECQIFTFGGAGIFMTHGHLYRAKLTLLDLDRAARERHCSITLFGHTHIPCVETRGTLMINPGSAADGRLALLEVADGRPRVNLLTF